MTYGSFEFVLQTNESAGRNSFSDIIWPLKSAMGECWRGPYGQRVASGALKRPAYSLFFVISTQLSGHHSPSDSIMATSDDFRVPLIPAGAVVSQEATNVPSVRPFCQRSGKSKAQRGVWKTSRSINLDLKRGPSNQNGQLSYSSWNVCHRPHPPIFFCSANGRSAQQVLSHRLLPTVLLLLFKLIFQPFDDV